VCRRLGRSCHAFADDVKVLSSTTTQREKGPSFSRCHFLLRPRSLLSVREGGGECPNAYAVGPLQAAAPHAPAVRGRCVRGDRLQQLALQPPTPGSSCTCRRPSSRSGAVRACSGSI
jgi:hypothetical protein